MTRYILRGGVLLLGCLILSFPLGARAGDEAKTIDELVARYDDSTCVECHADIHEQWSSSWHSRSVVSSLKGLRNFLRVGLDKEWKTELDRDQLLKCMDCHAPVVNHASDELAREIGGLIITAFEEPESARGKEARKQLSRLNVGCLSCHNIKATGVTRGLRGLPRPGEVYGPEGGLGDEEAHESIQSVDMERSVFCMQCHGQYRAPDGETIQCNTLSGSYQNAYLSQGGSRTCQDCHMSSADGEEGSHLFPGGHDLDTVRQGLGFDVDITPYRHLPGKVPGVKDAKAWVPSVAVTARITNRTGHRVPDG